MDPAVHAGLVTVAEPPHGTVTTELLSFAVTLSVPDLAAPVSQASVIFTPPEGIGIADIETLTTPAVSDTLLVNGTASNVPTG